MNSLNRDREKDKWIVCEKCGEKYMGDCVRCFINDCEGKTSNSKSDQIYYRVKDGCEQPMIFETLEEAISYLTDCLDGINFESPVSIEKVGMTRNQFNQLPEGL